MRKKENFLVLGMYSIIIAFVLEMLGETNFLADLLALLFIGIAIVSNASYLVLTSYNKKK
ncbi:MAG: hypothetical protein ACFFEY_02635 [Candidatus Thorarchaeota archaeon]